MTKLEAAADAVDALTAALAAVKGDASVHFYAPMGIGAFQDMLDELRDHGWKVENTSPRSANIWDSSARYRFVTDEDMLRVQLLSGQEAWKALENVIKHHGDVSGDDVPEEASTESTKVDWLKKQADKVHDAAVTARDNAKKWSKEQKAKVKDLGTRAIEKTRAAAGDVARNASAEAKSEVKAVKDTLAGAKQIAGWGAAGAGVLFLIIGGVILYEASTGRTQRRVDRERDYVLKQARRAGVRV